MLDPGKTENYLKVEETKGINLEDYIPVKEGSAEVLFEKTHGVFYNPVQQFNRDLSVAVLGQYAKKFHEAQANQSIQREIHVFEALAASGLRSIRYAKEVTGLSKITANDLSQSAVASIERNAAHNDVDSVLKSSHGDATMVMYGHRQQSERFQVVDLDPYGSPVPFLDSAVQCIKDGGLLMVTATDLAVLCGNAFETCFAKYGSMSLRTKFCHEMALRILLFTIQSHATRYGRTITPLLSVSVDFYVRIFVTVRESAAGAKLAAKNVGMVYQCVSCDSWKSQALMQTETQDKNVKYNRCQGPPVNSVCDQCGHHYQIGGPFWLGPLHDREFVSSVLDSLENYPHLGTLRRLTGILAVIEEELEDVPFYYKLDRLASIAKVTSPSLLQMRSALLHGNYRVSLSHCQKTSLKTNAPPEFIWDIMRAWDKLNPRKAPPNCSFAQNLLSKECKHEINFEIHPEANPESRKQKLTRFQVNPTKNWGPKARAKMGDVSVELAESAKRERNQGKKRKRTQTTPEVSLSSDSNVNIKTTEGIES